MKRNNKRKRLVSILLVLVMIALNLSGLSVAAESAGTAKRSAYGQFLVKLDSDPETDIPKGGTDGFGTADSAGRIWTDKSVGVTDEGSFEVTLSALAQEYLVDESSEGSTTGLDSSKVTQADVIFILDMSGSMGYSSPNYKNSDIEHEGSMIWRVDAMQRAVNYAIGKVMNANPNNRVGVYTFQGTSASTFMKLGSYTLQQGTTYIDYDDQNKEQGSKTIKPNSNLRLNGNTISNTSAYTNGGTPTQAGIMYGVNEMIKQIEKDTTEANVKEASDSQSTRLKRKPFVFILSDGSASEAYPTWNANSYGTGKKVTAAADVTALTILTGTYMKEQLEAKYKSYNKSDDVTSQFYTVGLGSRNSIYGVTDDDTTNKYSQYAWAGLDPKSVINIINKVSGYDKQGEIQANTIHTQINNYDSAKTYANNKYGYSDFYTFANNFSKLDSAFTNLTEHVEAASKKILPILSMPTTSISGTETAIMNEVAITISDEIGEGFSIDDTSLYIGTIKGEVDIHNIIENGTVFKFGDYKSKAAIRTVEGKQILDLYIHADDMKDHIYSFTSRNNPQVGEYTAPIDGAFQLKYKLEPIFDTTFDEESAENLKTTYYSNAFDSESRESKTTAQFYIPDGNPYYEGVEEERIINNVGGIGAQYISKESIISAEDGESNSKVKVFLGNNGQLDIEMAVVKKGPTEVITEENISYDVIVYNFTDTDKVVTINSGETGQVSQTITVPKKDESGNAGKQQNDEGTFLVIAPSTPTLKYDSEKATFTYDSVTVSSNIWSTKVNEKTYTVTFHSNDTDINVPSQGGYKKNDLIDKPIIADLSNDVELLGWYKDSNFQNEWNFTEDQIVDTDIDLYAKWNYRPTIAAKDKSTYTMQTVTGSAIGMDKNINDILIYTIEDSGKPINGTVEIDPNTGEWKYTPNGNFKGTDTFEITVSDGQLTNKTNVNITVNNQDPILEDGTRKTLKGESVDIIIEGSDKDNEKEELTYIIETAPTNGTIESVSGSAWRYTPNHKFSGKDSFEVTVEDGSGGKTTATIYVWVKNTAPTAEDINETIKAGTSTGGKMIGEDKDGDDISYSISQKPSNGELIFDSEGNWTYKPNDGFRGTDYFVVVVHDNDENYPKTGTATVIIKVENNTPTVDNAKVTTPYEKPVSGKVTGTDKDNDPLTYVIGENPRDGKVTVDENGNWTYTPDDKFYGEDSFKIKVDDGEGGITTSTITVTVNPNTPPAVQDYISNTSYETPVSGKVSGTDKDNDPLTYTVENNPKNGKVTVDETGNWTYTPDKGFHGEDEFTVKVDDGNGGTTISTITVTVTVNPNTPPTVQDYTVKTPYETPVSGKVTGTDKDNNPLTYTVGENPKGGQVTVDESGNWTYTPNKGFKGEDEFTVKVDDGNGGTTISTITVTVAAKLNTPPTVQDYTAKTPYETPVGGKVTGTDKDKDSLTYTLEGAPENGKATVDKNGNWTYTPDKGFHGEDKFTVKVDDGKGGSTTSTITVTVQEKEAPKPPIVIPPITIPDSTPKNAVPTVDNYNTQTKSGTPVSGKVTGTDKDGDSLTYAKGSNPSNGLVIVNRDGSWTYTPNPGFSGDDSFTVTVDDGNGGTTTSAITVKVLKPDADVVIHMKAEPNTIVADGKSTSTLTTRIMDSDNKPVAGITVEFGAERGSFPNGKTAVTDSNGYASVVFQSEKIESVTTHNILVTATVNDKEKGLYGKDTITIIFEPASIKGVVVDNETGKPIEGAVVTVSKDFDGDGVIDYENTVITSKDGSYKIPVPKGEVTYEVSIETPKLIDGKEEKITLTQKSKAGEITGSKHEEFEAEKTAAGIILIKNPDGSSSLLKDYSDYSIDVVLKDKDGKEVHLSLDADIYNSGKSKGTFRIEDLEKDKDYVFNVVYHFSNGESIIVGKVDVTLDQDGQLNVSSVLIDPYGDITDSVTGEPVKDVKVTLYYADTKRNKDAGRKPGDRVDLPGVVDFPPADNENPHYSDDLGKYAWMVFPEADYYIVAEKDGYETFISEIIPVGQEIVNYNFAMKNLASSKDQGALDNKDGQNKGNQNSSSNLNNTSTSLPKTGEAMTQIYVLLLLITMLSGVIVYSRRKIRVK